MLYLSLITVFASLVLAEQGFADPSLYPWPAVTPQRLLIGLPAVQALISISALAAGRRALVLIERTHSLAPVTWLDTVLAASRLLAAAATAAAVCPLGLLAAVRGQTGNLVLIDELLAVLPFLCTVLVTWYAAEPVERVLRESTTIRDLDQGRPLYSPPGRLAYVGAQARHHLLLLVLPMALLTAWSESIDKFADAAIHASLDGSSGPFAAIGSALLRPDLPTTLLYYSAKLSGLGLLVLMVPVLVRALWDTVPLEHGPLASSLAQMCQQQRIRVRRVLVWRTQGTMVNGAVLGITARARYILLTDALLDLLPGHFVKAVMAHEIGHVRCRHVPWLAATLFAASGLVLAAADISLRPLTPRGLNDADPLIQLAASAASMFVAVMAFGAVSRRFEWQADAFAVRHLSQFTPATDDPQFAPPAPGGLPGAPPELQSHSPTVLPHATAAMRGALISVASANHLPIDRFTFRHGSIATRLERINALAGLPLDRLPIDAVAARAKLAIVSALALVIVWVVGII